MSVAGGSRGARRGPKGDGSSTAVGRGERGVGDRCSRPAGGGGMGGGMRGGGAKPADGEAATHNELSKSTDFEEKFYLAD